MQPAESKKPADRKDAMKTDEIMTAIDHGNNSHGGAVRFITGDDPPPNRL
jgi:hypothetical protein